MNEVNAATPHAELIAELMNPNNPKNEREHAAVREIERLREDQQVVDAVAVLTEEGWIWDGDQWQRPALQSAWLLESTQTLAKTLAREFYPEVTQWKCLNDLAGVISQIDNMTTGLMRKPEQEPTGCLCRWDSEGDRVVTCARHEGWLEVIVEWADRAREAEKKLKSLANPVLQDIEQYRMQMAGICTAAIGYWKEGDGIHPDYDTLALQDVAKLYAKYDALYKAHSEPVAHSVIAGALFDFMGWLTSRKERLVLSSADEASPAVDAIRDFAKMRGLSLDDAKVHDWHTHPPQRTWVGLTKDEVDSWNLPDHPTVFEFAQFIEAKLKQLNT
jgi:hypothetical protein